MGSLNRRLANTGWVILISVPIAFIGHYYEKSDWGLVVVGILAEIILCYLWIRERQEYRNILIREKAEHDPAFARWLAQQADAKISADRIIAGQYQRLREEERFEKLNKSLKEETEQDFSKRVLEMMYQEEIPKRQEAIGRLEKLEEIKRSFFIFETDTPEKLRANLLVEEARIRLEDIDANIKQRIDILRTISPDTIKSLKFRQLMDLLDNLQRNDQKLSSQ